MDSGQSFFRPVGTFNYSYYHDIQKLIDSDAASADIVKRLLTYKSCIMREKETDENFRRRTEVFRDIDESCSFTIAALKMLPSLENEIYTYEREIRQPTSKKAERFKTRNRKLMNFSDNFYAGFLKLLENEDIIRIKSTSLKTKGVEALLRSFLDYCTGIPAASMLLTILLTLFVTDGWKSNKSVYSMLKPRKRKLSEADKKAIDELYLSIRKLLESELVYDLLQLSLPVFRDEEIVSIVLDQLQVKDENDINIAKNYYLSFKNRGTPFSSSSPSELKSEFVDKLGERLEECLHCLAIMFSANTYISIKRGNLPSVEVMNAFKTLVKECSASQKGSEGICFPGITNEGFTRPLFSGESLDSIFSSSEKCVDSMNKYYSLLGPPHLLHAFNFNDIEFLRCYNLSLDYAYYLLTPELANLCALMDSVSDLVADEIRRHYRYYIDMQIRDLGVDLYLQEHLIEAKKFAATIAKDFSQEDYNLLISSMDEAKQKYNPIAFRDFLSTFFTQKRLALPSVYNSHQMEVEFECLETMLTLCKIYLRSSFTKRYNDWYLEQLEKKRCT